MISDIYIYMAMMRPPGNPGGFKGGQVNLACPRCSKKETEHVKIKRTKTTSRLCEPSKNKAEESLYRVIPFIDPLLYPHRSVQDLP